MDNQTFKTPKASRRKVTTDLGRQIIQRERQRLAREQAALGEQLAEEARRKMNMQQTNKRLVQPEQIAISRGIVRRFAAVLQSEGVDVLIHANCTEKMSAWTDFEQIVINYRMHEDVRMLAATMRGLAYHEGGHCRFTVPFIQLVEMAYGKYDRNTYGQYHKAWNMLEDQRMETAVVSDSPRKAAYLTPMIMADMSNTTSNAAANWPLFIWRRYLPAKIRKGARKLFVAQHNLQGIDGEALAQAWERVTTEYVMADNAKDMLTAVIAAHELIKLTQAVPAAAGDMGHQQQQQARKDDLDDDALVIPIDPSMLEEEEGGCFPTDPEELPQVDIDTTDPEVAEHLAMVFTALYTCPETLLRVVYAVVQDSEETDEGGSASAGDPDADADDDASDEDESDTDEEGEAVGEVDAADGSSDDDEDEDEDDGSCSFPGGSADEDDDEGEGDDEADDEGTGAGAGEHNDDEPVERGNDDDDDDLDDEDLEEALQEAEAERDDDDALDGDMQAFQDALDNRVSDLSPYTTHASSNLESTAAAHNLAEELEQSFYASTMESAPQWVEQQRRGVVNVLRYMTRQPGDMEFFRQWTEDDAPGFNIAVSILLDYSGSMYAYTDELAQAGYAAKLACEKLGIPCTVVLWDTGAKVVWDADEPADYLPVIESAGGTEPTVALADLVNQRHDKAQHVVLIMTDGEWQDSAGKSGYLAAYKEQGRLIIGCGFSTGYGSSEALAEKLRRYGCDESYGIKSLMEIPRLLEQSLVAVS